MLEFEQLKQNILTAFSDKAQVMSNALKVVRFALIYGGAALSALAAVFYPEWKWPITDVQIIGLVGAALVCLGGFFSIYTEDSPKVLSDAQLAINHAESVKNGYEEAIAFAQQYEEAARRLSALYLATGAARNVLEQAASAKFADQNTLISSCLDAMHRDLRLALGFELSHVWTICVYERVTPQGGGSDILKCIAHDRTHPCDISKARTWKYGVGVGGMALARNSEVVAPDIQAPEAGSVFAVDGETVKDLDRDRYRSLIGVPVHVGEDADPMGVVVVTSNQPEHFGAEEVDGVAPEEGARALAGIVALAVALCRSNEAKSKAATKKTTG